MTADKVRPAPIGVKDRVASASWGTSLATRLKAIAPLPAEGRFVSAVNEVETMIGWKKAGSLIGNAILWLAAGGAFTLLMSQY